NHRPPAFKGRNGMKRLIVSVSVLGLFLAAGSAPARDTGPQLGANSRVVIPSSANVGGQGGTFFRTRLTIFNVTSDAFDVEVILYGGAGQVAIGSVHLNPGQLRVYENVLDNLFSFTGAG